MSSSPSPAPCGTPYIISSYVEANKDDYTYLDSAEGFGVAQSFTGDGSVLDKAKFLLGKLGSPTGNAFAKIYAITGTFGTDSIPTGTALAVSDALDVTTIAATLPPATLYTFNFTGANQITLTNGTKYAVSIEYTGGDVNNKIASSRDGSSPAHAGDGAFLTTGGIWNTRTYDNIFYIYGVVPCSVSSSVSSSPSTSVSSSISSSPSTSVSSSISSSPSTSVSSSTSSSISSSVSSSPSPAPGNLKYWDGSTWILKQLERWNGVAWVDQPIKYWDGIQWIEK